MNTSGSTLLAQLGEHCLNVNPWCLVRGVRVRVRVCVRVRVLVRVPLHPCMEEVRDMSFVR